MKPAVEAVIHNQPTLRVRTGVNAGGVQLNHNQPALRLRTGVWRGAFP